MSATLSRPQCVNSSRLSDAYICQSDWSSLVQIMVCCLSNAKWLSEPMLDFCQLNPREQNLGKCSDKSTIISTQQNVFEYIVCKMGAILSGPQCVNWSLVHCIKPLYYFSKCLPVFMTSCHSQSEPAPHWVTYNMDFQRPCQFWSRWMSVMTLSILIQLNIFSTFYNMY